MARVALVDDSRRWRDRISRALRGAMDFEVEAFAAVTPDDLGTFAIDVLLCDQTMEPTTGLELLKNITESHPKIATVLTLESADHLAIDEAVNIVGVDGILFKSLATASGIRVVRSSLLKAHARVRSNAIERAINSTPPVGAATGFPPEPPGYHTFTARERQVFERVRTCDHEPSIKELAAWFGRNPETIHSHLRALYRKAGECPRAPQDPGGGGGNESYG